MNPLLITTKVDLSGANALAAGIGATMSQVRASTATATASMLEFRSSTNGAAAAAATLGESGAGLAPLTEVMLGLTAAITNLTVKMDTIPLHAQKAAVESASSFDLLQKKIVQTAEQAQLSATGIGSAFGGLSALLGGGILAGFLARFIDQAKDATLEIGHLAARTGLAVETVAGLQIETQRLGLGLEAVQTGMIRLERAQNLALSGHKSQAQAFHDLGISFKELQSLSPEEVLNRVSAAMQAQTDQGVKANAAITLFGRGGAALIPIFNEYGDTLTDAAHKLGAYSGVTEQAVEESLKWQRVSADLGVEIRKLAIEILPLVTKAVGYFAIGIKEAQAATGEFTIGLAKYAADLVAFNDPSKSWAEKLQAFSDNAALARSSMADLNRETAAFVNETLGNAAGKVAKAFPDIRSNVNEWLGVLNGRKGGTIDEEGAGSDAEAEAREQAKLDHLKSFAEARAKLKSDEIKQAYAMGQISSDEEVRQLEKVEHDKNSIILAGLEAQKKALSTTLGDYAGADKLEAINGEIAALEFKSKDEILKIRQDGAKQSLKEQIEAQNERIAAIKAGDAITLEQAAENAAEIVAIQRQTFELVKTYGTRDEIHAANDAVLGAVREFNSALRRENQAAATADLANLDTVTKERLKTLTEEASREQAELALQTKARQAAQSETYKEKTVQPFVSQAGKLTAAEDNAAAEIAIARNAATEQVAIVQEAATKEAQVLLATIPAFTLAFGAGTLSAEEYRKKVAAVLQEIASLAQTAATKQTQIAAGEATEEIKIQDQLLAAYLHVKQQEEAATVNFVTGATSSLNNFAVTIATTLGVVHGRVSELRYIGLEFNKMFVEISKEFYLMILKMIEQTKAFVAIESFIKGVFDKAFSHIPGLGQAKPAATAGGIAGGAGKVTQETAATEALTAFTTALHVATAALTPNAAATHAVTGAKAAEIPATHAATVAHAAHVPAVHASSTAHITHLHAVLASTVAHIGHAVHVLASSIAHLFHAPAATADATATAANAVAMTADTAATIANAAVKLATLGFAEGGIIPFTGLHLLHAGERVLSVQQRAEYENALSAGDQGGRPFTAGPATSGGGGGDSLNFHYHAGSVNALDHSGVSEVLQRNRSDIIKIFHTAVKSGMISRTALARGL